jgi:hypothetical protein
MAEDPGDILRFTSRHAVTEGPEAPPLAAETMEAARALAPAWDIYALEADWRGYWAASGRPRLRSPDRAFLGYVRVRLAGGQG